MQGPESSSIWWAVHFAGLLLPPAARQNADCSHCKMLKLPISQGGGSSNVDLEAMERDNDREVSIMN